MSLYAGSADVKRILQVDFLFAGSTLPTDDDVAEAIAEAQDTVDHRTQHAWRNKIVTNEFYSFPRVNHYYRYHYTDGLPVYLRHRRIKTFDTDSGDKIEIWNGKEYIDWVADKTEGRAEDYWLDSERGVLYVRKWHPFWRENAIRLTYRYGETAVPKDIQQATAMLAAIQFIEADDRSNMLNETGDPTRLSYNDRIGRMNARINKVLHNRTEIIVV